MEKYLKVLSGVAAVGLYLLLLILLISYFNHRHTRHTLHFVDKQSDRIVVSLSDRPKRERSHRTVSKSRSRSKPKQRVKQRVHHRAKKAPAKIRKVKKPLPKKSEAKKRKPVKKEKVDLKHLFGTIKEKRPVEKRERKRRSREAKAGKRAKKRDKGIENAYFAKVENMLQNWPAQSEFAGERIKVWLKIRQDGSFRFRILSASGSDAFNEALIAYLKQLQQIGFGRHHNSRPYELNVEFIARE